MVKKIIDGVKDAIETKQETEREEQNVVDVVENKAGMGRRYHRQTMKKKLKELKRRSR